jgi:hypothetical protein
MTDISSKARRLSTSIAEATVAILGTGKVSGAEITATGGVVTVPSGSRIAWGARGPRPAQAVILTEDIDVAASDSDELYARQLPGGASYEIAAAVATPVGAIKLADLSGSPVDTVVDTSPARIGSVDAKEVGILDAAANYAGSTVEAALAEIGASGPVAKAFFHATMNDQTTDLATNDHVEFDDELENDGGGSIVLATGAGQANGLITLAAGKTYSVEAALSMLYSAFQGVIRYQWRDNTGAVLFGNRGVARSLTSDVHEYTPGVAAGIITPSVITVIELRIVGDFSLSTIRGTTGSDGGSYVKIVEIG